MAAQGYDNIEWSISEIKDVIYTILCQQYNRISVIFFHLHTTIIKMFQRSCLPLLLLSMVLLNGCADVRPWERGTLAKSHMALQPYPVQAAFREHIYGSRESASGGSASSGGGCGCY